MSLAPIRLRVGTEDLGHGLVSFALTALFVGALTGVMAATFRMALEALAELRTRWITAVPGPAVLGAIVAMAGCAAAAAAAAALVRRVEPHAAGSGIPRVEAVVEGRSAPGSRVILPVKYVGGLLSMGAGMVLGREGPSVQMGGSIGVFAGKLTRRRDDDLRVLVAAGAAAGLATAFDAPIAGGVFVLEELLKRFDPRTATATLLASSAGFATASMVMGGSQQVFTMHPLANPGMPSIAAAIVVGLVTGLAGVLYNRMVLGALSLADRTPVSHEVRAAAIGAVVGLAAFLGPDLVGGGDTLTQRALHGQGTVAVVAGVLLLRVLLGVACYAADTPGGLFAPMLVVGSHLGLLVALLGGLAFPHAGISPAALALVGMASFFTATVRAPITGVTLATELTGVTAQLPVMLGACAVAMLVATALRSRPIYDALTDRAGRAAATAGPGGAVPATDRG